MSGRLIWVADVAHFVKTYPDLNWCDMLDHARKLGFYRIVCLGLLLAEQIGGVQLPHNILEAIHTEAIVEQLARQAAAVQLNGMSSSEGILAKYYLHSRERYLDRA